MRVGIGVPGLRMHVSFVRTASVARMSKATSGADDPACRCAHAGYLLGQSSAIRNGGLGSCEDYRTSLVGKPKDEDLGSRGADLAWWKVDHGDHALAAKVLDCIVLCNLSCAFLQTYAGPEVDYQSVGWISCLREGHGLADGPSAHVHFKEVFERNFRSGGRRWIVSDVHRCSTAIWTERHYSDNAPAKNVRLPLDDRGFLSDRKALERHYLSNEIAENRKQASKIAEF